MNNLVSFSDYLAENKADWSEFRKRMRDLGGIQNASTQSLGKYKQNHSKNRRDGIWQSCENELQRRIRVEKQKVDIEKQKKINPYANPTLNYLNQRAEANFDPLIDEILHQIPSAVWKNPKSTFFDPAMGGGQFIRKISDKLQSEGFSDENISKRIFGIETDKVTVTLVKNRNKIKKYKDEKKTLGNFAEVCYNDVLEGKLPEEWPVNFDVIVGNPPYSGGDTSRSDTSFRGQGKNLAKQFCLLSLSLATKYVCLIMPRSGRTYYPAIEAFYKKNGLYKIEDAKSYFEQVKTNPYVFYFNKSKVSTGVEDKAAITRKIPKKNVGELFANQPGTLNRKDYEHTLKDTGKYKMIVTTSRIKFTNNKSLVDAMKDKTTGNWRVVMNSTTSQNSIGKIVIAAPEDTLSKSVHCLIVNSKKEATLLADYMRSQKIGDILKSVKVGNCNSKKFLQYIPLPDFISNVD